jgi:hypothetical protein
MRLPNSSPLASPRPEPVYVMDNGYLPLGGKLVDDEKTGD